MAEPGEGSFRADAQPITLRRSNLGTLQVVDPVNLERAVMAGQGLGGHYVQGHVDGIGRVVSVTGDGPSTIIRLVVPSDLRRYVVERGFVAIDGASLTVMRLRPDGFDVSLVSRTQVSKGIANVALALGAPVVFGVLTTETIEQAIERAGTKAGSKGVEAGMTAIEMTNLLATLEGLGSPGATAELPLGGQRADPAWTRAQED